MKSTVIAALLWGALLIVGALAAPLSWQSGVPIDGECSGDAMLRTDPTVMAGGTNVVMELHHVRYKAIVHGVAGRRLSARLAGEHLFIAGMCSQNTGPFAKTDAVKHVIGRIAIQTVSERYSDGSALYRSANRIRRAITDGVSGMSVELQSLFSGLVMGDDRNQSRAMLQNFRASGLSHLCAVSGQNVAYLLAAMSPLLNRISRFARWILIMGLLSWFVLLTRAEPSVLRAALMASLVATNSFLKLQLNSRSVLAITVMTLLIIDPMLAWSVGFALSVGATAGLAWWSASLGKVIGGRGVIASTLAAQVGTFPVSILVFGYVPVISLLANPFVIGVAGAVMMCGLPLALLAYALPPLAPLICICLTLPVWFVNSVATLASSLSPHGALNWSIWVAVLLYLWQKYARNARRHMSVAG